MPVYRVVAPGAGEEMYKHWRRAAMRTALLLLLTVGGLWAGLALLDGSTDPPSLKAFHALWNTANTISTLGSLTDLSRGQRIFMIVAMLSVVSIAGYAVTALTGILARNDVRAFKENRRMERVLSQLENHVVIVGFGPIGRRVAAKAEAGEHQVVVIDRDADVANDASNLGHIGVQGSVSKDRVLERVNIGEAQSLVITIDDPDRKLAAILMARVLNPDIHIVVLDYGESEEWLLHAGASEIVDLNAIVADKLLERLDPAGAKHAETSPAT